MESFVINLSSKNLSDDELKSSRELNFITPLAKLSAENLCADINDFKNKIAAHHLVTHFMVSLALSAENLFLLFLLSKPYDKKIIETGKVNDYL